MTVADRSAANLADKSCERIGSGGRMAGEVSFVGGGRDIVSGMCVASAIISGVASASESESE